MFADFELAEIDRLNRAVKLERERMRTLIELLHLAGVEVWFNLDGCVVVNEALEPPYPIRLGPGYTGLGAAGN